MKWNVVIGRRKKAYPLSDVWEIPYLNPKANRRTGYPTQKPIAVAESNMDVRRMKGTVLDPLAEVVQHNVLKSKGRIMLE